MTHKNLVLVHSELALAAYANLAIGRPAEALLIDIGMTEQQALKMASEWRGGVRQWSPFEKQLLKDLLWLN